MLNEKKLRKIEQEKTKSEIIVTRFISESGGWLASQSTKRDDFDGVDIVAINPKTNKQITIDVKNSNDKNRNSPNFLFTTVNGLGKPYTTKRTDYVAFLNRPESFGPHKVEIVFIEFNKLTEIIETNNKIKYLPSKEYKLGRYVLIPKYLVRNATPHHHFYEQYNVNTYTYE